MDNEINLFDMLLAKKLGGGGGQIDPTIIQAETFSQLTIPRFIGIWSMAGVISIQLGGSTKVLPILFTIKNDNYFISGGATDGAGNGAAFLFTYTPDTPGVTFIEAYIVTEGTWADVTQYIASMASNIAIFRYPI